MASWSDVVTGIVRASRSLPVRARADLYQTETKRLVDEHGAPEAEIVQAFTQAIGSAWEAEGMPAR